MRAITQRINGGLNGLAEREDYYKALSESQYVQRRARLVEIVYTWWSDVLRANSGIMRS